MRSVWTRFGQILRLAESSAGRINFAEVGGYPILTSIDALETLLPYRLRFCIGGKEWPFCSAAGGSSLILRAPSFFLAPPPIPQRAIPWEVTRMVVGYIGLRNLLPLYTSDCRAQRPCSSSARQKDNGQALSQRSCARSTP